MTAETYSAVVRPASTFSTEKKKGGHQVLSGSEKALLGSCTTVSDALDVLSEAVKRGNKVEANKIGGATSVES